MKLEFGQQKEHRRTEKEVQLNLGKLAEQDRKTAERFVNAAGYRCSAEGITVEWNLTGERIITVAYDGARLKLTGTEKVHFYRALHLFFVEIQRNGDRPFQKAEQISFSETGIMLDCSRNGVMTVQMVREMVDLCAACGLNQIYLYMEDVYEMPEDPYFGAYRGRYSYEELKSLDAHGRQVGVELIPCIQTLAHLRTYLKWPKARTLRDTSDILLVGSEETEAFVRAMIHNASRPFSTNKIHVGMDEAEMLGLGQYLRDHGYQERYGIMAEHLKMVLQICEEEHLKAMMWSDMFFRLMSPTGGYYDIPEDAEFARADQFPENLELVYWDYYHHSEEAYKKNIDLHLKITKDIRFAGGGWTWNGIAPNYRKAERTLEEGIKACRKEEIGKTFCTFWFDNGTETPVRTAVYSILYYAQLCYRETVEETELEIWLQMLTGYGRELYRLLDEFDSPTGVMPENEAADNPSKFLLYQDALAGIFDGQIQGMKLGEYYGELEEKLHCLREQEGTKKDDRYNAMGDIAAYYEVLAGLLKEKAMLGVELRETYLRGDTEALYLFLERLDRCICAVERLKELRENIWMNECKVFGYEVLDIRIGGVGVRLQSAKRRLQKYLAGEVCRIGELEEPLLPYRKDRAESRYPLCPGGFWDQIVSAGNMAGI